MERKEGLVDFHFHSEHSDGSESIRGIVEEAKSRGVVALALTDHNNGNGVKELTNLCKAAKIAVLEGTEVYASFAKHKWSWNPDFCGPVPDVTILGRKLDWEAFRDYQEMLAKYRLTVWMPKTLEGLRAAGLKVPILTKEEIQNQIEHNPGLPKVLHEVPNDPDNWERLWRICLPFEPGITKEEISKNPVRWANRHLYAISKQAYVLRAPREWTVEKAVKLAEKMGGVLFAAHPGGDYANWSDNHLNHFVEQGGGGVETYQYFHSPSQIKELLQFARKNNLLVSGGSDWHGKNGKPTLGCWNKPEVQTPYEVYEQLLKRLP